MKRLGASAGPGRPDPQARGAYDTPRDVAGHLAQNTLVPALLEASGGAVGLRHLLRRDPGRYLRPELRHGWALPMPAADPDLPAAPALGLAGETWGQAAARRLRCAQLMQRLGGAGELELNDLVMANVDLQRLTLDALACPPAPEWPLAFWNALERLTVLDPTCGSGAFLAAAADLLEPLYAACLERLESCGGAPARAVLARAAAAPSRRGFVLDSILRNNLYGVDLSPAAVARCRQRLARLGDAEPNLRVGDALLEGAAEGAEPFQWGRAFPAIMAAGGFQVILGNPPYGRIPRGASRPLLRAAYWSARPRWSPIESLATLAVERCLCLLRPGSGRLGLVLPLAVACSTGPAFATLRRVIAAEPGLWLWSHFDRTPNALFGRAVRTRCSLAIYARSAAGHQVATTGLLRWKTQARSHLFATLHYARLTLDLAPGIPKVASQLQADVLQRLLAAGPPLGMDLRPAGPAGATVFVGGSAYGWFPAWRELPAGLDRRGRAVPPARTAAFGCPGEAEADQVFALLCSSLGYWWWRVASDGFNLKRWLVLRFPFCLGAIPEPARRELAGLGRLLRLELRDHYVQKANRGTRGNFLLPACSVRIQAIDRCLEASVPGLSAAFMDDIRADNAAFAGKSEGGETV
jgi:SAM-dependent methyltransferase